MSSLSSLESEGGSVSSPPAEKLAFLVHSQNTARNNLLSGEDNRPLTRQRRKRTSPEDQKILEEEFRKNSKPDRASRLQIVSKVHLGEKEVQIWFQNRRQNSRRRSRPLNLIEVREHLQYASIVQSSDGAYSDDSKPRIDDKSSKGQAEETTEVRKVLTTGQNSKILVSNRSNESGMNDRKEREAEQEAKVGDSQSTVMSKKSSSSSVPPSSSLPSELNLSQGFASSQETKTTGYLANRRSASFLRQREELFGSTNAPPTQSSQTRVLDRSSSFLRLSMTDDGQARVIDRAAQSPSPSRSQTSSLSVPAGLRRSYSAAGLNDMFKQSAADTSTHKQPRVSSSGRSRDSRAWEFWCDSDARNSLAEKAEQEASGSAADAIGLIRQSSKKVLRPNASKANTPISSQDVFAQNKKSGKPQLKRASTAHGCLQQKTVKHAPKAKKGEEDEEWEKPSTDSDKENWEPEDGPARPPAHHRRAHARSPAKRTVLGESTQALSQSGSLKFTMSREKYQHAGKLDDEVAVFMGSAVDASAGDELDCVQSLLSLSQGNWK